MPSTIVHALAAFRPATAGLPASGSGRGAHSCPHHHRRAGAAPPFAYSGESSSDVSSVVDALVDEPLSPVRLTCEFLQ